MAANVLRRLPAPRLPAGPATVRAAGGVLLRPGRRGQLEIALVHRPGRDDWSLPKGKLDPGESFESCAVREVMEETGYRCEPGAFAGCTAYVDRRGRPKVVAYWYMEPARGVSFQRAASVAVDEVDEVRWLRVREAARALSYPHDRELLDSLEPEFLALFG
jgi:8-oxo-dGTP diphosphatase